MQQKLNNTAVVTNVVKDNRLTRSTKQSSHY